MREQSRTTAALWRRALPWVVATAALAFVAWAVPLRDRCWDARAPGSTRASVTRDSSGCTLHLRSGDVAVPPAECAALSCEPGLLSTLEHARPGVLGVLLGVYALGTLAWAARWRELLGFAGVDLSLPQVWRTVVEAQAGGILLPGGLGGDALRVASVIGRPTRAGETRAPPSTVVASVLLDRVVGLALIAALAAGLAFVWGGSRAGSPAFALAAIPVTSLAGWIVLRAAPPRRLRWLGEGRLGRLTGPALEYLRDPRAPRAVARACALGLVVAATQIACVRGLVLAVGAAPTQERWVYLGTALAFMVAALPALPGAWGTADAAYVFFFGLAGIAPGAALGVSLLFRIFWYVCALVGAVLSLTRRRAIGAGLGGETIPAADP